FGIVQTDNAPPGIENHRGGNHRAKQCAATGLIDAGAAHPAQLARRSLETGGAESAHSPRILPRSAFAKSKRRKQNFISSQGGIHLTQVTTTRSVAGH